MAFRWYSEPGMSGGEIRSRAKLRDVARLAGVSPGTASLVLSGKAEDRRIAEETHRRILAAAKELNYAPSLLHRSVRRGRTHILSFYSTFQNREPGDVYMDRLATAIEHAGGRHGFNVLVHCVFDADPAENHRYLNGGFADGVILFGPSADDPLVELLREGSLPVVLFNPEHMESALPSVLVDETGGLTDLADALFDAGHRRLVTIGPEQDRMGFVARRFETIQARYRERGVDVSDAPTVRRGETARETIERILASPTKPTAIFAWHDRLAYWLLEGCLELGVRVPEDLSIVGFDGIVWPSKTPHVVTSVHCSIEELGHRAVRLLARLVEGGDGPRTETLPARYLPGTTLGPVPR